MLLRSGQDFEIALSALCCVLMVLTSVKLPWTESAATNASRQPGMFIPRLEKELFFLIPGSYSHREKLIFCHPLEFPWERGSLLVLWDDCCCKCHKSHNETGHILFIFIFLYYYFFSLVVPQTMLLGGCCFLGNLLFWWHVIMFWFSSLPKQPLSWHPLP